VACRPSLSGLAAVAAAFDGLKFGPAAWKGKGQFCGIRLAETLQVYEKMQLFNYSQIAQTVKSIQGWANLGPSTGFSVEDLTRGQSRGFWQI
jgi:hypothetical protein